MRYSLLACVLAVTACAHRADPPPQELIPFGEQLSNFAALQNSGRFDELRSHFTKEATIQSPVTPQPAGVDRYLRAVAAEPYTLTIRQTEVVYSFPGRAMTQSDVVASAPARFNLPERLMVEWRLEDGYWRIARIAYADWSPIIGIWRRGGLKNEGALELRVMPGGSYVVYRAEDYSAPAFRGRYRLEGNKITLADTSAFEAKQFQNGEGGYLFVRTPTGLTFRKVGDENAWRAERFDGAWTAVR